MLFKKAKVIKSPNLRIVNYGNGYLKKKPKRALLSYLPEPIERSFKGQKTVRFSNDGIALAWPKVLNNLGYSVDIVNWDDTDFVPKEDYDLFIAHGAKNFEHIYKNLVDKPKTIYFSTGSYWKFHNQQEEGRFKDFKKRHGIDLPKDRYIEANEEFANKSADAIICLGNKDVKETYNKFKHVYNLPIGCFPDDHLKQHPKDFESNKFNFLFHAGGGNIHKGLDLAIDAFELLPDNYHLTIMTPMDKDFKKYYSNVLSKPKYQLLGSLDLRSPEFYEALDNCNYVILPSCSEGSPGSVVECMMQGIIPIVSTEAHIDVGKFGIQLSNSLVGTIKQSLEKLATMPLGEIQKMSNRARHTALNDYSPAIFEKNLINILKNIGVGQ